MRLVILEMDSMMITGSQDTQVEYQEQCRAPGSRDEKGELISTLGDDVRVSC